MISTKLWGFAKMAAGFAFVATLLMAPAAAQADRVNYSATSLYALPGGGPGTTEGGNLSEDFETFAVGPPSNGWTGFSGTHGITDINTIQGTRSFRLTSDGSGFNDSSGSPTVAEAFGVVSGLVRIDPVGDAIFQWNTIASNFTFNTRLNFNPNGTIDALQVDGMGMGVFFPTTGSWSAGQTFQIAIETTPAGVLNVYQDGANIFTGDEINFALSGTPMGAASWGGFLGNTAGSSGSSMTLDVFGNTIVPEPSSLALLAIGGLLILGRRRV